MARAKVSAKRAKKPSGKSARKSVVGKRTKSAKKSAKKAAKNGYGYGRAVLRRDYHGGGRGGGGPVKSRDCTERCPDHDRTCRLTGLHVGRHKCPEAHFWNT
jgi:hypothetical protein